ncbi:MAG: PAS domain-containing protein [Spirochaetales bacterium]|nr:PAS domain-containing protein [Spirochaetales bacterium]
MTDIISNYPEPDYRFFFESLDRAAVVVDSSGIVLSLNEAGRKLFADLETDGLLISGDSMKDILSEAAAGDFLPLSFVYMDRKEPLLESLPFTGRILAASGTDKKTYFLLINILSVMDGQPEKARRSNTKIKGPQGKSPLVWVVDTKFRYISFNEAHRQEMNRVWGVEIHVGDNLLEFLDDERYKRLVIYNYNRAFSGEHFYTIDELEDTGDGSRYFENVLGPYVDDNNKIIGLRVRTTELTDSDDVKDRLQMSIAVQRSLIEGYGNIRISSVDRFFRYRAFNDGYRRFMDEVRGVKIRIGASLLESLSSDATRHEVRQKLAVVLAGEKCTEVRSYSHLSGGVVYYQHDYFPVISVSGEVIGITIFSDDVTEIMNRENEVKEALKEKGILLREIHFRVKHNLQLISSLLNLHMSNLEGEESKSALEELSLKVQTLSLIHEQLYQGQSLGAVQSGEFFNRLSAMLIELRNFDTSGVIIEDRVADMEFDMDTAIPLGLFFNEIFDNCLTHAFTGKELSLEGGGLPGERKIYYSLSEESGLIRLTISNEGGRLWSPRDPDSEFGLGLKLASTLAEQLEGELGFDFTDGTSISLVFKRSHGV